MHKQFMLMLKTTNKINVVALYEGAPTWRLQTKLYFHVLGLDLRVKEGKERRGSLGSRLTHAEQVSVSLY